MKKIVFILVTFVVSCGLYAQDNDTLGKKQEMPKETQEDMLWKRIDKLTLTIADKDKTIAQLRKDSLMFQNQIAVLKDDFAKLQNENSDLKSQVLKAQEDKKQLSQTLLSIDGVLAKQCLLYPLERRYNKQFVDEAISSVEAFVKLGNTSDKFNAYRNTYEPLLKKYSEYNQQIVDFLQQCVEYIEKREAKNVSVPKAPEIWDNELKALPYYQYCYVVKDRPPYKSIIYLDERIDEINAVMKSSDNLKEDLLNIISKLKSK